MKRHGGHITVASNAGEGTQFTVYLPVAKKPEKKERKEPAKTNQKKTGRVLVMDDEAVVRTLLSKVLSRFGFTVDSAATGEEALEIFNRRFLNNKMYEVVITDLTVPGSMGGVKLTEELHKLVPELKVIISSGYSEGEVVSHFQDYGFYAAVRKPFSIEELKTALGIDS